MPAPRRSFLLRLPLEDAYRFDICAARRNIDTLALLEHIVTTWLDGPGQQEIVDALLKPPPRPRQQRPRQLAGQLRLVD